MDTEISPGDLRNNRLKIRGSRASFSHGLGLSGAMVMMETRSTIAHPTLPSSRLPIEQRRTNNVDNSPVFVRKTIDECVIKL